MRQRDRSSLCIVLGVARGVLPGVVPGVARGVLLGVVLGVALSAPARGAELRVAPDTIEARAQGCATCHGAHGEGTRDPGFPRIAGKPAGYLFNQLQNFRDGQRSYPPMNYLLAYMHDDYLRELADYFSTQRPEPALTAPPVASAAKVQANAAIAVGERLVRHGNTATAVPACERCHGSRLTGMDPGIPGLVGLNGRYIAAQLVSWRVGTRRAKPPDCMREIATRLTEPEVSGVAAWLAAEPAPSPGTPAAAGSWTTPIPCGSEP
jgi:cytochrome c553